MHYRKVGTIAIFILLMAISLYAQDVVVPLQPYDGNASTFVNEQIVADTLAAGGLMANRVYELARDQVYLDNAIFTVPNGKTLRLRAADGVGNKPVIYLWESGTGSNPTRPPGNFVVLNGGNLEISNICIAGYYEFEPERLDGVQGGLINTTAVGSSIILDGVILSNINGQHVRTGQNTVKVKITNSIFANMGALTTSNLGAGKGIDLRDAACDSFILVNNTFVNYQDRAIRHYNFSNPQAGTGEIGYGRIEHNTFINGMGFHGLFSLGNVGAEMIITNNLFVDAFALGEDSTDVTRAAEWANTGEAYKNGNNKITWIFTAPNETTEWKVSNNYYTISDSGWAFLNDFGYGVGAQLSDHIMSRLGVAAGSAFKMADLSLLNTPQLMTNMMRWYEDPNGGNRIKDQTNFVTARDDYDRRPIEYYRDELNAAYSSSSVVYTGAQRNFPAGDLNWFPEMKTKWENGESITIEEVVVPLNPYDGTSESFVNAQIVADTVAAGGLMANRVYELARDQVYLDNAIFTVPNGKTLRLRAADGAGKKPVIYLWESGTGSNPTRPPGNFVVLNGGNLEISNVCIAGFYEFEPERLDGVQGGLINTTAVGSSIILDGVILSNINGQHVRTGQNTIKVKITNSIFANMGALTTSNLGAGKGIDLRDAACDSFIIVNNTFVNYQDRAIRHYNFSNPQAGTGEIKYGRIEHNTFINGMGFHGLFSLGNVGEKMTITNNLFVDAFALGEDSTDVTRAAEWANTGEAYKNGNNKITWIFTAPNETTEWKVSNNYYTISDSGWAFLNDFGFGVASQLSDHIMSRLGDAAASAFTMDDLSLMNTPRLMTNMMRWYEDPNGGNRIKDQTNFVTARDDYDRRRIEFYRDSLNASYSTSAAAYKGAEKGYPAGDLNWFPDLKSKWEQGMSVGVETRTVAKARDFQLKQNYPNPFNPSTEISYVLGSRANVTLNIYNALGQRIATLVQDKVQQAGTHTITWNGTNDAGQIVAAGLYFYRLESPEATLTRKMLFIK
ncbi:T9SS type A sorting domain-containing protein [candidate division KSB1 bacterium]|nr:T9SS type A sorting domain-containing protein [candidate division KSB1 bacterium]